MPLLLAGTLFCGPVHEAGAVPEKGATWAAGLSAYAEIKNDAGRRKKMLQEYTARVQEKNEVSLQEQERDKGAVPGAISREKGAFIFTLLRQLAGDAAFMRIERTLATGAPVESWSDIRALFENEAGLDLGWFFSQWVERKGLPDLRVENAVTRRAGSMFEVSFDLVQKGEAYVLDIPVAITLLNGGSMNERVKLDAERKKVVFTAEDEPAAVVVDGGYEVPRKLVESEMRTALRSPKAENGIVAKLREEPAFIDMTAIKTLSGVLEQAADKKIIYVGEYHDRHAHHQVQLQTVRELQRRDPKVAIGMEMFQRPFQKALDEYINGAIDEREFLKRSEYFKRWSYDYNLYKPILDFARREKIPVVALNARAELVSKISKSGLDALSEEERKELPAELDLSDTEYRGRLRQAFEEHQGKSERNFEFFYQAQVAWDESMAQSVDDYLKKNDDRRMVVIAGLGHLLYGSGIPQRAYRRNGYAYATILNDADLERGIGDYLVFPSALEGVSAPKLMVALKEAGDGLAVVAMPEDSMAKKAGVLVGDTILSLDGERVKNVEDMKILLFYKKPGESVILRVLRKRFILSDKEMEIEVKF